MLSGSTSSAPSTTQEEQEETPLWVRREQAKELNEQKQEGEIPFGVYLLASCIVAIAAVSQKPTPMGPRFAHGSIGIRARWCARKWGWCYMHRIRG